MIHADESIIGKTACALHKSIVSNETICETHKINAYMVQKGEEGIYATIRFDNGSWHKAKDVFYPQDEAREREKFEERFGGNS